MKTVNLRELREVLQMSKACFEYRSRDGTIHKCYGTLQYVFIPENLQPKFDEYFEDSNFRYFDLEKNMWRNIPIEVKEVDVKEQ